MRDKNTLKGIGDACGGFVEFDRDTEMETHLLWVRMKVKISSTTWPATMEVAVGNWKVRVTLWWEIPPKILPLQKPTWVEMVTRA